MHVCAERYLGNGVRQEQQLQIREFNEELADGHHRRSRSALPLGSHELFHRRVHPDQARTCPYDFTSDSLPEGTFISPVNRTNDLLPKLARNMTTVYPGTPQPPKVAFTDTVGINLEEYNATPPSPHLFSFCHYCGRSSGIRLTQCPHCQNAVYCSQSCRQSHWDEGHKAECIDPNSFNKSHKRCE